MEFYTPFKHLPKYLCNQVTQQVTFPPPRNEEISLFFKLLGKPPTSLKVDSHFYYLKNWDISQVFLA
jgi:hypothetical protein